MKQHLAALALSGVALASNCLASPTYVYEGTRHDAMYGICFAGDQGVAVGDWGAVLTSTDGGDTWSSAAQPSGLALLDLSCNANITLIVGQSGLILKDGPDGFSTRESGTSERLLGVSHNSSGLAVAVGSFGTVLRSRDGGESWEPLSFDWEAMLNDFLEPHLYDVMVDEAGVVTMAGEFGLILQSQNAGDDWAVANKSEASLFGLTLDGQRGYAVGQDSTVLATDDGGASWRAVEVPAKTNLLDVWAGDGQVVISGIRTIITSGDDGASWQARDDLDFLTGWYQNIAVPGAIGQREQAFLVGKQGRIVALPLVATTAQ
ncbi:MAG: hypothetical protein PVJ95_06700 [Cellvibrionales bacterium]|jgi:photosystem II stability/assembly factor-like uncharacterized protein